MKNLTNPLNSNSQNQDNDELLKKDQSETDILNAEKELIKLSETFLSSLPYPAMYVRRKDRIVIAANNIALSFGVRIGEHCWRGFGKSEFISDKDFKVAAKYPNLVPEKFNIQCTFCLGDQCILEPLGQKKSEVKAFGRFWDTYWIKVSADVFLHYLIDITEQKQLEESLRESELFLKQTQQIAMLGTYKLDFSTGIWQSSEILNEIFGFDTNSIKNHDSWMEVVHPDWQEKVKDYFNNDVLGNKIKFNKEYKIIRKNDKAERWVHALGDLIFDNNNHPINMIGTIQDITERKQSEEERKFLIAAVENSDSIVTVKDLNLRVVAANQAFVNSTRHSSVKSLIGKTDAEIYEISADSEPVRTYMEDERKAQKLKPGEFILREEPLILPDGKEITILTRKYPIFDSEGKLFCTGNVSTNITVLKKAEEALWLKNISFDSAIAANIITDINGYTTEANEAFLRIFGYRTKNEVAGRSILNFVNEIAEAQIIISNLRDNGQWEGDYIAKRVDGSTFTAHSLATCMKNKEGKIIGYQASVIDITDRKRAEEALRKSEQMLQTVLDHFPGIVFWKDRQSNYLGCNQVFATAAGLNSPSEVVGKTDLQLPWGETEGAKYRAEDYEVMEKGFTKLHIIGPQHQADGKVIWFDTNKIPLREPEGKVIGVIGVSNDITDRKIVEDALVESEEKYRTIANFTNDWEYWLDPNDNFLYCSPSCERISGYNAMEFIQNPKLLVQIMHPDDIKTYLKHKQELLSHNCNEELQFRIFRFDGQERWIGHVSQPVFNESDDYIGIRGSNRDITERKKTEEKLKNSERKYMLLSKNITDGVFTCRNGHVEYINDSMSRIFGYEESELEELKLSQLVIPERRNDFETFISVEPTTNQTNNIDIECVRKDGSTVFVEIFLNYVASEELIYGVMHDITEKRLIQEKKVIQAIIQTEENERTHFSKELHDGLGPLLSTIKLYLQWSMRPKSNRSREEIILKAEEILEEALTAVKEISNKLSPHLLTNYGLTSALQSFANKLQETNAIGIDFRSNLTRRVEMETEVALYRAIIECINNTIKHAQAKHIYIILNDAGNQLQLQYRDDGKGFDIVKILLNKKGLGLFNLQNRIQTIGGEIKMFSKPHEGVNYHINVPVKPIS